MFDTYPIRPMTINGYSVVLHAWELQPKEETFDCEQQVNVISSMIENMRSTSNCVPIYIQGPTRSGKTILANVLKESVSNVELIDVFRLMNSGSNELSTLITDIDRTYIVDEAVYGDIELAYRAAEHAQNGGMIIIFVQDIRSLGLDTLSFEPKPKYLYLERGYLSDLSL